MSGEWKLESGKGEETDQYGHTGVPAHSFAHKLGESFYREAEEIGHIA